MVTFPPEQLIRPKSVIATLKRDDQYPRPFRVGASPISPPPPPVPPKPGFVHFSNGPSLNDFVQFLPRTNVVGGAFEDLSASAKICQVVTTIHTCSALVMTENLSE